jgi:hypothetical protein
MPTRSQTRKAPPRFAVRSATWLRQLLLRGADRMLPTHLAALEHSHQFARAHILATMAELGVADHLADGPRSAQELAASIECDADALHRLLRAAATCSLVRLDQKGWFHATRFTDVLRSDHESGAADWCRYIGSSSQQSAWLSLTESVRTGRSAFRRVHGGSMFEWFDAHPNEGRHFSAGLGGLTLAEAPAIIACYPFPETGVVCDLGGGQGVLLGALLDARPGLRGVLVDSAAVLDQARSYLRGRGLEHRVELVEGDLLGQVEAKADVYLLKWILHDWDDATCVGILRSAAATMHGGARLIVIEGRQPRNMVDPRFSMIDLQMLVVTEQGRERSAEELAALLSEAGLQAGQIRSSSTGLLLIDAAKAK